jgi:hydrogenase maturation factor
VHDFRAAREAGVSIVTGDTKVVERGAADQVFINTSGVGVIPVDVEISAARARPGDVVIVNGSRICSGRQKRSCSPRPICFRICAST